ncbi:MAG: AAA family ATPase [Candidatus Synoicihabitans palmerolidicus]|nr:AAA family ATPase [Candidatus Synoicihabitans palmerolidicus]
MILQAIELHHVGRFRETVRLDPFAPGLNILAAPNESGKSTALHAAARALFDKHTTKGEELKALQPAGTDLAPRIAVEFATAAGRYRIEKTFLLKPTSELREWQFRRVATRRRFRKGRPARADALALVTARPRRDQTRALGIPRFPLGAPGRTRSMAGTRRWRSGAGHSRTSGATDPRPGHRSPAPTPRRAHQTDPHLHRPTAQRRRPQRGRGRPGAHRGSARPNPRYAHEIGGRLAPLPTGGQCGRLAGKGTRRTRRVRRRAGRTGEIR